MSDFDTLIDDCVGFIKEKLFKEKDLDFSIVSTPLEVHYFPSELLSGEWEPLIKFEGSEIKSVNNFLREATFKRLVIDNARSENNDIEKFCVLLDFCYYTKVTNKDEDTNDFWSDLYFELLRMCLDFLHVPLEHLDFWPYVESRLEWFKQGRSADPVPYGSTNLTAIRAPMSKLLFHVNRMLKNIENYSKLNTPAHYKLSAKLQLFLGQLLNLTEGANVNKRGEICTQFQEQLWSSNESVTMQTDLFRNWRKVVSSFICNPLEWAFSPAEFKSDFEKYMLPLVDVILKEEYEFYIRTKKVNAKTFAINKKLNPNYPRSHTKSIFQAEPKDSLSYISDDKAQFWRDFVHETVFSDFTITPLPLEISFCDGQEFYDQVMDVSNDFYRKSIILQIVVISSLVERILTKDSVNSFYKARYTSNTGKKVASDELGPEAHSETLKFFEFVVSGRIMTFYNLRDPNFHTVICNILRDEETRTMNKIENSYKGISEFKLPTNQLPVVDFDYSFKKYGWVKLGNKKIDNVWKIPTGLNLVKEACEESQSANELYASLKQQYDSKDVDMDRQKKEESAIVKQWRVLRYLRPQYMFEFNKVDEDTGIGGLFDTSLIEESKRKKELKKQESIEKEKEEHLKLLTAARNYTEEKKNRKKRALEEEELEVDSKSSEKKVKAEATQAELGEPIGGNTSKSEEPKGVESDENGRKESESLQKIDMKEENVNELTEKEEERKEELQQVKDNSELGAEDNEEFMSESKDDMEIDSNEEALVNNQNQEIPEASIEKSNVAATENGS